MDLARRLDEARQRATGGTETAQDPGRQTLVELAGLVGGGGGGDVAGMLAALAGLVGGVGSALGGLLGGGSGGDVGSAVGGLLGGAGSALGGALGGGDVGSAVGGLLGGAGSALGGGDVGTAVGGVLGGAGSALGGALGGGDVGTALGGVLGGAASGASGAAPWSSAVPAVAPAVAEQLGLTSFDPGAALGGLLGGAASGATAPLVQVLAQLLRGATGAPGAAAVQRAADGASPDAPDALAIAARGVAGAGASLPHLETIQRAFGHHDVTAVRAHTDDAAASASAALGARAYATGADVAFRDPPSLFLAAHEAAHVVQQRGGVQLAGGVGAVGDAHEQHADAVAERVVRGESAEALLDRYSGGAATVAVQRDGEQNQSGGPPRDGPMSSPDQLRAWLEANVRMQPQPPDCINVFANNLLFARIRPQGEPGPDDRFHIEVVDRNGQPTVELHLDAPGTVEGVMFAHGGARVEVRVVRNGRSGAPRPPPPAPAAEPGAPERRPTDDPPWWVFIPLAGLFWRPIREAAHQTLTQDLPRAAAETARGAGQVAYERLPELVAGIAVPILAGFHLALAPESFVSVIQGKVDVIQRLTQARTREEKWNILLTYCATETLALITARIQRGLTPVRGTISGVSGVASWVQANAGALKGRLLLALFSAAGNSAIEALRDGGLDSASDWQQFGNRITRSMVVSVVDEVLGAMGISGGSENARELANAVVLEIMRTFLNSGIEQAQNAAGGSPGRR